MRIVFVSYEFPPQFGGGIGTYVAAITRTLADRGHDVSVITVTAERYPCREDLSGIEVIRLPIPAGSGPEPMATLRCWQSRSDAISALLHKMHDARPIDIIEFGDYRGEGFSYLASTKPGERPVCIVKLHTPLCVLRKYNTGQDHYPVLESFEDQAILMADRLVSPSAALVNELREHLPQLGPVDVLPNAADPTFLAVDRSNVEERNEIVYVGRLEQRKGVETLIQAAPDFLLACPCTTLHLVGGDTKVSPTVPSMKARLQTMLPRELADRVFYHGAIPRPELMKRCLAARVCVFPSLFENFPNTCLEAMSLGRPVIGTDNSGMAEMIVDGKSGRIVRAADVNHLATTLIDLYHQPPAKRQEMGEAARQRVINEYHPDIIAPLMEKLYASYLPADKRDPALMPSHRIRFTVADRPEVAVVIPCYNHGQFLRDALRSVADQDWPVSECVIVDDGSTDPATLDTFAELEAEGVRIIHQRNQGLAGARNTGVQATHAPFYVALDADDKIAPRFISTLIRPLLDDPSLGYCYSHAAFFGAATGTWKCPEYNPRQLLVENLSVATAVVRREAFDVAGGYQTDMIYGFEDWDFWLAMLSVGYYGKCCPEPLFMYRKHPRGQSMLDSTQTHRAEMVRRIVSHHRDLFASMLDVSLSDKDAMFFQAHMDAWRMREAGGGADRTREISTTDDALYQSLQAQAQLDYLENSGSWQMIQRFRRSAPWQAVSRLLHGPQADTIDQITDPRKRLTAIKRSRFYRLLRMIKRSRVYNQYARRKYGPDFVNPFLD